MTKKLNLNKSIYELTKEYPELINLMESLGFREISKKAMLNSVGKMMTIPKGAKVKNISMMEIVSALMKEGFEIEGEMPNIQMETHCSKQEGEERTQSRKEEIKTYLKRLEQGDDLEQVRHDFVQEFEAVDASEIMEAEQELLKEGTPLVQVQKLCDVHSALFHGSTVEEKVQSAKEEKDSETKSLEALCGHPLYTFGKENQALSNLIAEFKENHNVSLLNEIRQVSIHYAKKGDLLYPLLKVKYGVSGPSEVMWTVDDEIRDGLALLMKDSKQDEQWNAQVDAVFERLEEMIYKEENILFPICVEHFTKEEWFGIYQDSKDYDICFGIEQEIWEEAEKKPLERKESMNGEILMPGGHLSLEQLTALLNTIPMEITFVDAENMNRYFNEGEKVFKRPSMALDREVFSCHPPKIEPMVRQIIDDFRRGRQDSVSVWMEKKGRVMLVKYMAVRNQEGKYLGTVELVQDMQFAKEHFSH